MDGNETKQEKEREREKRKEKKEKGSKIGERRRPRDWRLESTVIPVPLLNANERLALARIGKNNRCHRFFIEKWRLRSGVETFAPFCRNGAGMCVCVCVRERERDRDLKKIEKKHKKYIHKYIYDGVGEEPLLLFIFVIFFPDEILRLHFRWWGSFRLTNFDLLHLSREREKEREREREREKIRVNTSTYMYHY